MKRLAGAVCVFLSVLMVMTNVVVGANPELQNENEFDTNVIVETVSGNDNNSSIDDGGIYAIYNIGATTWASTAYSSSTVNTHNLFQYSNWTGTAQNFRFVSAGRSGVNTYIIYPLEYGNNNADETRALCCDYSQIEGVNPIGVNVLPATFSSTDMESFEWLVTVNSDGSFTIRLYADQRYILSANATGNGSVETTGVTATGNIIARKTSTTPNSKQKWNLHYALQNGSYYFKNRFSGNFLEWPGTSIGTVYTNTLDFSGSEIWIVQHISNGRYFIVNQNGSALCIGGATPMEYSGVSVEPNMAQPRFQWTIQQTGNGSLIFQNCVSDNEGNYYVLKGLGSSMLSSAYIGIYTNDENFMDEWYFCDATQGTYAHFFIGQPGDSTDMSTLLQAVENSFFSNAKMAGFGYTSTTKSNYLSKLDNVQIFSHIAHGVSGNTVGTFPYVNLVDGGILDIDEIDNGFDEGDLDNIKLAVLASCYSANGGQNATNLASYVYSKGADVVVGFSSSRRIPAVNYWLDKFFIKISEGGTVQQAIDFASDVSVSGNFPMEESLTDYQYLSETAEVFGDRQTVVCP